MITNGAGPQEAQGHYLGLVTGGSLSQGVEVRLDSGVSVEEVKDGIHVHLHGVKDAREAVGAGRLRQERLPAPVLARIDENAEGGFQAVAVGAAAQGGMGDVDHLATLR